MSLSCMNMSASATRNFFENTSSLPTEVVTEILQADTDYVPYDDDQLPASSGDPSSASQPVEEDSSTVDEDLISTLPSLLRDKSLLAKKKNKGSHDENHLAPHIEFLSPPPERLFCS